MIITKNIGFLLLDLFLDSLGDFTWFPLGHLVLFLPF